jgi:hypothetical protein
MNIVWFNYYIDKDGNSYKGGNNGYTSKEDAKERAVAREGYLKRKILDRINTPQGVILKENYSHSIQLPEVEDCI